MVAMAIEPPVAAPDIDRMRVAIAARGVLIATPKTIKAMVLKYVKATCGGKPMAWPRRSAAAAR